MNLQSVWQATFSFFSGKPIIVEPVEAQLTSDAGLLPIRQFDEQVGMTAQFAKVLDDPRCPEDVDHTFLEMTRMRVYGILADYVDQNDHDVLRRDPLFKILAGRSPDDRDLASQPTLSRFENAISAHSLLIQQNVFIDQFIASFAEPPRRLTLDLDTFDDPTHGQQQLTFFDGYYDQYQYLVRAITCAQNDLVVMPVLLHGTAHAALGADSDLEYVVRRLRAVWPDVEIELRADSGFATPKMYEVCERLGILFTIGLKMNQVLQRWSASLLAEAVQKHEETGDPQRLFCAFWYRAESWPAARWVVVKCEANAQGTNRRAVVTNRSGAFVLFQATYDAYAERGESENRNKELKCGLQADRLSDHRYMANCFRLHLHCLAFNLLTRLRLRIADPPAVYPPVEVPQEALAGHQRHQYHNQRREADPLGEGHPCTWRTRLIKVAAEIVVRARCIRVRLSGCWPYLEHYQRICEQILPPVAQVQCDSG